jgi:hypothetical protein
MRAGHAVVRLLAACALAAAPARAAGPLLVNGAGAPLAWTASPVPYNPDKGSLGALGNAAAIANVAANFAVWSAVPTASVTFVNAGPLPVDVTAANYDSYIGACNDGLSPIIFDSDGTIIDDLLGAGASTDVLGFAGPDCGSYVPPVITEGFAVLNGRWIDGIATTSNPEIPLAEFNGVFVHEFGHYLNLDHSQVNLLEAEDGEPANDDAVATMYPFLVNGAGMSTPHLDDAVAVSTLYPDPSFASGFGQVTGTILRSDAITPFQGAYVIARRVGDPRLTAVGTASGALFFPSSPGGPPPASLQGAYAIPGLPAGSYTVEVEAIDPAFTGGSSVGPLSPPLPLPGPPEFWSGASEAATNPPDDPALAASVAVAAGTTQSGIDVVLNVIPPAANDLCGAPTVITTTPFRDFVDTSAVTTESTDPLQSCTFRRPGRNSHSVWYSFTPSSAGTAALSTLGSDYDTVLTVHTGGCGALAEVACSDDVGGGFQSSLAFIATGGTTYLIEVTAYGDSPGGKLELSLEFLEGCGDGVVGAGEACDEGAGNGGAGCCSSSCRWIDGDGDGLCDREDVCPTVSDPAQVDGDGDGLGDACDLCATISPGQTAWLKGRLSVSGIEDGLFGNERLKLSGQFTMATGSFSVDPLAEGALVEVRSAGGFPRIGVLLPPGPYRPPGPGWTRNASGTRFAFRDGNPGGTGGIVRMIVKDEGGGAVRVVVGGSRATLGILASDAPLEATVVLGGMAAGAAGECGEIRFLGPRPAPACVTGRRGSRVTCR